MTNEPLRTLSGRSLDELNLEAILADELTAEDFRISGETLRRQAEAAEAAGYQQLAENLRRAAELTRVSKQDVLDIYTALRPGRATYEQLLTLADRLEKGYEASLTAAFIREAAEVYRERNIVKNP